jgi:hypothetical protein
MPPSTPIARSKTAALSRITDSIPKGYCRCTSGVVKVAKAEALAKKLHALYGIGCTPAQRITRKKHGLASALLVMYWPAGADLVHWLMLATEGDGLESETLRKVTDKPRVQFLGYELVRHTAEGRTRWTWRRPAAEMAEHYSMLAEMQAKRHTGALAELLERLARQPGFHGVREQTWSLAEEARRRGYDGDLPHLFYVQKVSHGDRMPL